MKEHEEFSRGVNKDDVENDGQINEFQEQHKKMLQKIKKLENYLTEKIALAEHSEL